MTEKNVEIELNKINSNNIKEKKTTNLMKDIDMSINVQNEIIKKELIKKENLEILSENKNNLCNFEDCKIKIGLLDKQLKCKCGNIYCKKHRHFFDHKCNYDYKNNRNIILEKIVAKKIEKI